LSRRANSQVADATLTQPAVRCAIYTRKSTEEGLDQGLAQEFNSLDAQREAAEAYIASQKAEGWVALPERYDDGGFSGGSMERPAMKRLLRMFLLWAKETGRINHVPLPKDTPMGRSVVKEAVDAGDE